MKKCKSVLLTLAVVLGLAGAFHGMRAATVTIDIVGYSFSPSNAVVTVGDTVTWSGLDNMHNITGLTPQDLDQFCGPGPTDTDTESNCSQIFNTVGTFPYECTIHGPCCGMMGNIIVVAAAAQPPLVSITSPTAGSIFAAPASFTISASATVSNGTVTNVQFFANSNSVGSAQAPPFTVTASNLAAGAYSLAAVATAAGCSATFCRRWHHSDVACFRFPIRSGSGQWPVLDYNAATGSSYIVQSSTDLMNWIPVSTNVASGATVQFSRDRAGQRLPLLSGCSPTQSLMRASRPACLRWLGALALALVPSALIILVNSCSTGGGTIDVPLSIPGAHEVGNKACADCHAQIVRGFLPAPMRAFA